MDFKELMEFIDFESKRLGKPSKLYPEPDNFSDREKIFARTIKLTEELGELCDEILAFGGNQRQDKLAKRNPDNLSEEFADVLITTLILAKTMNIDIEKSLRKKIEKINDRYK